MVEQSQKQIFKLGHVLFVRLHENILALSCIQTFNVNIKLFVLVLKHSLNNLFFSNFATRES